MNKRQLLAVRTILKEWPNTKPEDEERVVKNVVSSLTYVEYVKVRKYFSKNE
jgi:hypothetical protein